MHCNSINFHYTKRQYFCGWYASVKDGRKYTFSVFFVGPNNRTISSDSAFLFSINNPLGLQPFKIDVKEVNKTVAATSDPTKGPLFGIKDLWITFDNLGIPRHSESQIGNAYSLPEGYDQDNEAYGFGLFAETISFTWDDFEVFYYDGEHIFYIYILSLNFSFNFLFIF